MTYRDELHAAELRIAALEEDLAAREAELDKLRDKKELRQSRWLALPIVAAVAWIGFSGPRPSPRQMHQLELELEEARSETMQAREDGRAALEALRQQVEAPRQMDGQRNAPLMTPLGKSDSIVTERALSKEDPLAREPSSVELGHGPAVVWVDAEPSSELTIDGTRYGKTPLMVRVAPGMHALTLSHPRRGVQTYTVSARAGETVRVSARLDGKQR